MSMPTEFLTQEQVDLVYQLIVNSDAAFMEQFARSAIASAALIQTDMWNDGEAGVPLFDTEDVRGMAADFTSDMLNDFKSTFVEKVMAVKMAVDLKVQTTVAFD